MKNKISLILVIVGLLMTFSVVLYYTFIIDIILGIGVLGLIFAIIGLLIYNNYYE